MQVGFENKGASGAPVATTPTISSGSGAPSSTPAKIGDIYVDTSTPGLYYAVGTTNSGDWVGVTNAA